MNDPKPSAHPQALARQRAQLVMQVRSGLLSAQEAARQLGISRKTYYKWERRSLVALVEALGNREQGAPAAAPRPGEGGPPTPDPRAAGEAPNPGADGADPSAVAAAG
jgi:Helix-turn-helix domain